MKFIITSNVSQIFGKLTRSEFFPFKSYINFKTRVFDSDFNFIFKKFRFKVVSRL